MDEFHEEAGQIGLADPREEHAGHRQHPSAKEYVRIGVVLFVLTAIEVWLSYSGLPHGWLVGLLWFASIVKFLLVAMWFMHLRFDDQRYSRFFTVGVVGAITLYAVVLLMFGVFKG